MRRLAIFIAIALAVVGVAFAVIPFGDSDISPETWRDFPSAENCGAPIVEAFRTHDAGWFGYAPLTSTPFANVGCKAPAQRRLTYAGMFILAAGVIVVALKREGGEA